MANGRSHRSRTCDPPIEVPCPPGPSAWPPRADDPGREWWFALDDCDGGSVYGPFSTPEGRRTAIRSRVPPDTPVILFSGYNVSLEICPAGDV